MEKQSSPDDEMTPPETESQLQASETASKPSDSEEEAPRRARPRTILLAVGIGLVATVILLIFVISDRVNTFDGADRISDLLDSTNNFNGDEFEPIETTASNLEDWFFLKHGLEHYAVPKQFADIKTMGCRVFKFNGATVAQIEAISDKKLLLYMFPANDLGIKIGNGKWEIVEADNWVGGLIGIDDTCFLVAFQGTKDEMRKFVHE